MQENEDSTLSITVNKPKVFGKPNANGSTPSSQKLNKVKKTSDFPNQKQKTLSATPKPTKTTKKLTNAASKPDSKHPTPKSKQPTKTIIVPKEEESIDYDDYDYNDNDQSAKQSIKSAKQDERNDQDIVSNSEKAPSSKNSPPKSKKQNDNQSIHSNAIENDRVSNYSQKAAINTKQQSKNGVQSNSDESEFETPVEKNKSDDSSSSKQEQSSLLNQISKMLNSLLSDQVNSDQLSNVTNSLENWQQKIILKASPIEKAQIQLWYESLLSLFKEQNMSIVDSNIEYKDYMMKKAREVISSHRFSYPGGNSHRFKLVVTGPNSSGKSTLLSAVSHQLLFELIASGNWKRTFIFPINIVNISHICQDLGSLYVEISRIVIEALSAQRPLLIKYKESLSQAFADVVRGKPLLPKSFTLDDDFKSIHQPLQEYLNQCYLLYHDSTAIVDFSLAAFMIPHFLSKIFGGFHDLVVIIDHFDVADVTINPTSPFEESTDTIFVVECFKYLLNRSSFIIGVKYEMALSGILSPVDPLTSAFSHDIEFISTLGVVCDDEQENNENRQNENEQINNEQENNENQQNENEQINNVQENNEQINHEQGNDEGHENEANNERNENHQNETEQINHEQDGNNENVAEANQANNQQENTETNQNNQLDHEQQKEMNNEQNDDQKNTNEYPHQKYLFNVSFEEPDEPPLSICSEMFGGCALYLTYLDRICEIAELIENLQQDDQSNSDDVDVEEEKIKLVIQMQNLLKITMRSQDRGPYSFSVKNVAFTHKEKK